MNISEFVRQESNGCLITFEGNEGCGKSTQVLMLQQGLEALGRKIQPVREPGSTRIGEAIRAIFKDINNSGMTSITELFLVCSSRADLIERVIRPALHNNVTVLADRFIDSTAVYQGILGGIPADVIHSVNSLATKGVVPRITFLLKVPPIVSFERVQTRLADMQLERMDSSDIGIYEKISAAYDTLAEHDPERFCVIDGTQSIEAVHQAILHKTLEVLNGRV